MATLAHTLAHARKRSPRIWSCGTQCYAASSRNTGITCDVRVMSAPPSRRTFLELSAGAALASACSRRDSPAPPAVDSTVVRIASVPTAVEGDLLPAVLQDFPARVEVAAQPDVYGAARAGRADLVISHYGHHDCERFVLDGLGEWPRTVFSNQMALVGPPADPARIRGLTDAAEAFERIAATRSPFVVNDLDGVRYLTEILWQCIGCPDRAGWFIDDKHQRDEAMATAARLGGYSLWGLTP